MKLGSVNQELFGEYPRFVGNPRQFLVYDESTMRIFLEKNWGSNNMYSRIGYLGNEGNTVVDKVSVDFDGPGYRCEDCGTLFDKEPVECSQCDGDIESLGGDDDAETIRMMRNEREFANLILGDVVDDVRRFAQYLIEEKIPAVGIFTGLGFHVHTLYKPRIKPDLELRTTALKWRDELNLETMDKVPIGDVERLMRMANCARITEDGEHCDLYTVPWTLEEMRDITIRDLLTESFDTRNVDAPSEDRKEMRVYPEYRSSQKKVAANGGKVESFDVEVTEVNDEDLIDLLEMLLPLPCIHERITQRDPRNPIRFNAAVMLFNRGFGVEDVHNIFSRLGWRDFDSDTTRYYLNQIWREEYREMSCATLMERQFCVREEEPKACPTYDWSGGESWYGGDQ